MNKTKTSIKKISEISREIFVVVIGVGITLSASYWITNRKEKSDMTLYLNTIKLELTENKKALDEIEQHLQKSYNYTRYLSSHNKKSLNADSIRFYSDTYFEVYPLTLKTNAFEMFKTSGNMRFVSDKELLLSIWDTYAILVEFQQQNTAVTGIKVEDMRKETQHVPILEILSRSDEEILKNVPPMYNFHVNVQFYSALLLTYRNTSAILNETLSKFE